MAEFKSHDLQYKQLFTSRSLLPKISHKSIVQCEYLYFLHVNAEHSFSYLQVKMMHN